MRFKTFRTNTIFTEVFTKQDWDFFNAAYAKTTPLTTPLTTHEKDRRGIARGWITDVLQIFADSVNLTFAQAKQLFETGESGAIVRMHMRMHSELQEKLDYLIKLAPRNEEGQIIESIPLRDLRKEVADLKRTTNLDPADVAAYVREKWTRALSIQHPAFSRHAISGASIAKKGEAPKIGDKVKRKSALNERSSSLV